MEITKIKEKTINFENLYSKEVKSHSDLRNRYNVLVKVSEDKSKTISDLKHELIRVKEQVRVLLR